MTAKPYYEHAGITIYHGDCRELLPTLPAPDLLLADPPYGVKENTARASRGIPMSGMAGAGKPRRIDWPAIVGDDEPFDPAHLLTYPRVVLWGANHYADKLPPSPSWIVWDKREGQTPDDGSDCEMAWTNLGGPARLYHQLWRGAVQRGEENGTLRLHPTQKPVALMAWVLSKWTSAGDLVVDPYAGSGPVLLAAKRLGRRAIGIEIEERYCEVAAKRLAQEVLPGVA